MTAYNLSYQVPWDVLSGNGKNKTPLVFCNRKFLRSPCTSFIAVTCSLAYVKRPFLSSNGPFLQPNLVLQPIITLVPLLPSPLSLLTSSRSPLPFLNTPFTRITSTLTLLIFAFFPVPSPLQPLPSSFALSPLSPLSSSSSPSHHTCPVSPVAATLYLFSPIPSPLAPHPLALSPLYSPL